MAGKDADQLHAVVDMGSNGIRFSITDLSPPNTRSLPTIYQSRLGISLYDAQYTPSFPERQPIPNDVIDQIISALKRFKQVTLDFGVPQRHQNVRILATEATRTAVNSAEFIAAIEAALGDPEVWRVKLLAKEDEGRIGALGVVSSVGGSTGIEGLMMDLGGGSVQLTWLISHPSVGTSLQTSPIGSISLPYGAAALTRLLSTTPSDHTGLRTKITSQFRDAISQLALPPDLMHKAHHYGLPLYLSGGGFRGWGYLLMSSHRIRPYPIPLINGFVVPVKDFKDTALLGDLASQSLVDGDGGGAVFRVSKRRAAQVPAVSLLIGCLIDAVPFIREVRFCQGGVREGSLFEGLSAHVRDMDPLVAASAPFAVDAGASAEFARLLGDAIPGDCGVLDRYVPAAVRDAGLLRAFANVLFLQQGASKESAAVNALHVPVTGVLASAHGPGHTERALLALMLCWRWGGGGELPAPHGELRGRLELLLCNRDVWWARYLGVVGACVAEVYPAGRVRGARRVGFGARWAEGLGKKGNMQGVVVTLRVVKGEDGIDDVVVAQMVEDIETMGRKKNRAGGKEYGFGLPLHVDVMRVETI